jgi:hypothetical protein
MHNIKKKLKFNKYNYWLISRLKGERKARERNKKKKILI